VLYDALRDALAALGTCGGSGSANSRRRRITGVVRTPSLPDGLARVGSNGWGVAGSSSQFDLLAGGVPTVLDNASELQDEWASEAGS